MSPHYQMGALLDFTEAIKDSPSFRHDISLNERHFDKAHKRLDENYLHKTARGHVQSASLNFSLYFVSVFVIMLKILYGPRKRPYRPGRPSCMGPGSAVALRLVELVVDHGQNYVASF
ncbi:hypothetical protein Ddc_10914 [Ditylenchus destructor]|nr:hypothetical protein Ddc_10914 [Ditylenchus destructor]